jgi:hypothetical protein
MLDEEMKMRLKIINTVSGCTASVRWASLTMDYVGRPIPSGLMDHLLDSHFAVCSCPNDFKQYCKFGHLPNCERRNPQ